MYGLDTFVLPGLVDNCLCVSWADVINCREKSRRDLSDADLKSNHILAKAFVGL